jgi:AcrR family transcriptional regulator
MRSDFEPVGQVAVKTRTFIEEARRAQIIKSTIEALADLGYQRTTLAEIARRAGISKGVISYHFAGKEDLMREVISQTFKDGRDWTDSLLERDVPATEKLREYINGNVEFIKTNPRHLSALLEIFQNHRREDGTHFFESARQEESSLVFIDAVLQHGQARGELREFSTRDVATPIRGAVEVMPMRRLSDPAFDIDLYGAELFELFRRAIRADGSVASTSSYLKG